MISAASQSAPVLGWMACLADATRLRLLRLLERHELGVIELCDILQLPQSTVSRHLKLLTDDQWIRGRRLGTTRLYRMILDELEPAMRKFWLVVRDQTESWSSIKQDQLRLQPRLQQRQLDSQTFFAGAASQWDKLRRELYGQRFSTAALLALLPANYVVADLGCGTGELAADLAPFAKQVIGIDNSAAMLKAAKRRTADFSNVELHKAELSSLPIESASCDAALLVLALTYVDDVNGVLGEVARILKPAGRAIIVDLLPHDRDDFRRQMGQTSLGLEPQTIQRMMGNAHLSNVTVRPLPPEPNVKGPALFLATGVKP